MYFPHENRIFCVLSLFRLIHRIQNKSFNFFVISSSTFDCIYALFSKQVALSIQVKSNPRNETEKNARICNTRQSYTVQCVRYSIANFFLFKDVNFRINLRLLGSILCMCV